ncbi:hypothetical protein DDE05_39325 [Streptomyces cavourensis]|nr:hypothetical protein DDE05_39325 [Streptomyces cavourensis]
MVEGPGVKTLRSEGDDLGTLRSASACCGDTGQPEPGKSLCDLLRVGLHVQAVVVEREEQVELVDRTELRRRFAGVDIR